MHKLTLRTGRVLAVFALPLLGACSSSTDTTQCLTSGDRAYAVAVTLMDSATGAKTPFDSVAGWVTEDNILIDSVDFSSLLRSTIPPPQYLVQMAAFRPGTYTVEITAKGYSPWIARGVEAQADLSNICGDMLTRRLTARLQREP